MSARRSRPRFSILMPTRNRGHLLSRAIETVLRQRFGGFEIVVVNNCSEDDTKQVVASFADPRIRYVETDRILNMSDNWEGALDHVAGEWMTVLCDDDALCPDALESIEMVLQNHPLDVVMTSPRAFYFDDSWYEHDRRRQLSFRTVPGGVRILDSEAILRSMFELSRKYPLPYGHMAFYRTAAVRRIRSAGRRFFFASCPDYTSAAMLLSSHPRIACIDEVLAIWGGTDASVGLNVVHERSAAMERYMKEYDGTEIFAYTPLKVRTPINGYVNCLLESKDLHPDLFSGYDIDQARYYTWNYEQLRVSETRGTDVRRDLNEWRSRLDLETPSTRRRVWRELCLTYAVDCVRSWTRRLMRSTSQIAGVDLLSLVRGFRQRRSSVARERTFHGIPSIVHAAALITDLRQEKGDSLEAA